MDSGLSGTDVQQRVVGRYKKGWVQARIQDFLTEGGALIFPRCSTVPGNRLIRGRKASSIVLDIYTGGLGWRALAPPSHTDSSLHSFLHPYFNQRNLKQIRNSKSKFT